MFNQSTYFLATWPMIPQKDFIIELPLFSMVKSEIIYMLQYSIIMMPNLDTAHYKFMHVSLLNNLPFDYYVATFAPKYSNQKNFGYSLLNTFSWMTGLDYF